MAAVHRPGREATRPQLGDGLRHVARLTGLELKLLLREPMVAVGLIGFPLVTVLVLGGVFGSVPDPDFGGVAPADHYLAGYLGVVMAAMGLITLPVHIATHRELGVLRRFRASGVTSSSIVISEIAVGAALATAASCVVLATGTAVYGFRAPEDPLAVVGWYAAGMGCFIAVGCALGSVLATSRAANAVGNLVFVPMFLLGGGGPPRAVMTGVMGPVSDALPLSHVVGGLRQSWLGQTDDPHQLWWPLLVAGAALAASSWLNRRRVA